MPAEHLFTKAALILAVVICLSVLVAWTYLLTQRRFLAKPGPERSRALRSRFALVFFAALLAQTVLATAPILWPPRPAPTPATSQAPALDSTLSKSVVQVADEIRRLREALQRPDQHAQRWSWLAWMTAIGLVVVGFFLLVTWMNPIAGLAGFLLAGVGALTASFHLLDLKVDNLVRIGEVVICGDCGSTQPDSSAWRLKLTPIATIARFPLGETSLAGMTDLDHQLSRALTAWSGLAARGGSGYLLVVGGVDRLPPRRRVAKRFGDNFGLAHARAIAIRDTLLGFARKDPRGDLADIPVLVSVGPIDISESDPPRQGYPDDRRVEILLSSLERIGATHPAKSRSGCGWWTSPLVAILVGIGLGFGLGWWATQRRDATTRTPTARPWANVVRALRRLVRVD